MTNEVTMRYWVNNGDLFVHPVHEQGSSVYSPRVYHFPFRGGKRLYDLIRSKQEGRWVGAYLSADYDLTEMAALGLSSFEVLYRQDSESGVPRDHAQLLREHTHGTLPLIATLRGGGKPTPTTPEREREQAQALLGWYKGTFLRQCLLWADWEDLAQSDISDLGKLWSEVYRRARQFLRREDPSGNHLASQAGAGLLALHKRVEEVLGREGIDLPYSGSMGSLATVLGRKAGATCLRVAGARFNGVRYRPDPLGQAEEWVEASLRRFLAQLEVTELEGISPPAMSRL